MLGVHRHGSHVRDRVRHVDELDLERAGLDPLARLHALERRILDAVLIELAARHLDRQRTAEDPRTVRRDLTEEERQRPEVVLVAVRDDDRVDVRGALDQVGEVGQDEVDAVLLLRREAQTDVDHDDVVALLDDRHVLADLTEPAQRQDPDRCCAHARASAPSTPTRSRPSRITARSSSLASTIGRRTVSRSRMPSIVSAAFVEMHAGATESAV